MNNLKIIPYKISSSSAKFLANFLNIKRIFPNKSYKYLKKDILINWGYSSFPPILTNIKEYNIINPFESVANCVNKINCLTILRENNISCIDFTTNKEEAIELLKNGNTIYCRTLINSTKGNGIVIANTLEELVDSKLYTIYFKNTNEYRVHVFDGKVIDIQEKKRMSEEKLNSFGISKENRTKRIRNHDSGWCFCRENIVFPEIVGDTAIKAVKALGLTFGACDISFNSKKNNCAVLEINTAPGLEEGLETHKNYCKAFSEYFHIPFSDEIFYKKYPK